ncbi:MAG: DUF2247 family protein [Defluviitaleaceae bacterium]|nr:DUF2247 family protein [Defluviitaleaceae bacterium]
MNSLNILFPYSFAIELIELNWYDILVAVNNGFLSHQTAIDHALRELSLNENPLQDTLNLAILTPAEAVYPHSIFPYLEKLANDVSEQEKSITKQKMLYLILKWISDNKVKFDNPLNILEFIYADFDYPDNLSHLVRYMPRDPSQPILNDEELFKRSNIFLEDQKFLFDGSSQQCE